MSENPLKLLKAAWTAIVSTYLGMLQEYFFLLLKVYQEGDESHSGVHLELYGEPDQPRFPLHHQCPPNGTLISQTNHLATIDDTGHTDPLTLDQSL